MEVEALEMGDKKAKIVIRDITAAFANALRRIIVAEVPCMAIDDVFIVENQSALFDELLAHRLGLIPLKTDLKSYVLPEECSCKSDLGCSKCRVTLTLNVQAPKDKGMTVYSGDLKSENPKVVPVSDKIPIVKLASKQKVKIEAYGKLGLGKTHAKWKAVTVCGYKFYPKIDIDAKRCDLCGVCVEACPTDVLKIVNGKLVVDKLLECISCMECVNKCPIRPPPIKVGWDEHSFVFNIEGTDAIPVSDVIVKAASVLNSKAKDLLSEIKKV